MMRLFFAIVIMMFTVNILNAQKIETILFLKDGKTKINNCRRGEHQVKCEEGENSVIYTEQDLLSIEYFINDLKYKYVFITRENVKNPILAKELIQGEVSLYSVDKMTPNGGTSLLYAKRKSDILAYRIGTGQRYTKSKALSYFSDCTEILDLIKNKKIKGKNIEHLINQYNINCKN